jgi:hypothetical protein
MVTIYEFDENRAFADLVCADPEFLRVEFNALVGASWDKPPDGQPAPRGPHQPR